MPRVGFEPTIPLFERAKTVLALDRVDTVIHLRAAELLKNPSLILETGDSLPYSQKSHIFLYPQSDTSRPHSHVPFI
jgi:hypothetical protein